MMKQQQQRPGHAGMEKPPKVVAVLQALNNKNGDFEWTDVAVLEALASLLSGVLARFALIDEALREKSKATALLKVAEVLASQDNCRLKASNVIKAITSGCDCERASFVLVDEVRGEQSIFSLDDDIGNFSAPLHSGVSGAVIRECLPVHIRDAYKDPRFNQEGDGKSGFKTRDIMAVPIVRAGTKPPQVMGVIMALNSNETGFDAGNETLLRSVALQVAGRLMPELIQDMIEATVNDHGMGQEDVEKFKALLTAENAPSKAVQRMADQVVSGDMVNELISSPLAKSSGRLSPIQTRVPEEMNRVATPAGSGVYTPDARPTPLPDATRVSLPVLNSATLFLQPRGLSSDELISWDLDILELEPIEVKAGYMHASLLPCQLPCQLPSPRCRANQLGHQRARLKRIRPFSNPIAHTWPCECASLACLSCCSTSTAHAARWCHLHRVGRAPEVQDPCRDVRQLHISGRLALQGQPLPQLEPRCARVALQLAACTGGATPKPR